MNYFGLFLFVFSTLSATAKSPSAGDHKSISQTFNGPDRTITWRSWQKSPASDFRFRTGDRYLGHGEWEHYLGFEQYRASVKVIKLFMIRLGNLDVREDAVIRPGSRYAIIKVTNGAMTAHKGVWSWHAQEVS
jgi:hypothetical protein